MSKPTRPEDFLIANSRGNILEGGRWRASAPNMPKIEANESDETVVNVKHDKATYLILDGGPGDFRQLRDAVGIKIDENTTIEVESRMDISGSKNRKIALLEYGSQRSRIGDIYLDINRICRVSLHPGTQYILPAIRLYGEGEVVIKALKIEKVPNDSKTRGPLVEYYPLSSSRECSANKISKIEQQISSMETKLNKLVWKSGTAKSSLNFDTTPPTGSYFSPATIRSAAITGKPTAHVPGRIAADQVNDETSHKNIGTLLFPAAQTSRRKIVTATSSTLSARLTSVGEVSQATPGRELEVIDTDTAYLVIEEDVTRIGPWSGLLDAQGTGKFSKLTRAITAAKTYGTVVTVVSGNVPHHFTGMLRAQADVIVSDGVANHSWDSDVNLPVIHAIEAYTSERSTKND